jgi:hypothetical protein
MVSENTVEKLSNDELPIYLLLATWMLALMIFISSLVRPLLLPNVSILVKLSSNPLTTLPKTVWRPSKKGVGLNVMKN